MKKVKPLVTLLVFAICMSILLPGLIPTENNISTVNAATTTISLNSNKLTMLKKDKFSLQITGTQSKVSWTSSNESVATVSSKGKVTAKGNGTAKIVAKVKGKKYKCNVTVTTKEDIQKQLYKASEWYTSKIWNDGLCDISWYLMYGTNSTGNSLNIDKCIKNYKKALKKKDSYTSYINSITNKKYDKVKNTWNDMMTQVDLLTAIININEIVASSRLEFPSDLLQDLHWKFSEYYNKL